jgi:hypothetical protein
VATWKLVKMEPKAIIKISPKSRITMLSQVIEKARLNQKIGKNKIKITKRRMKLAKKLIKNKIKATSKLISQFFLNNFQPFFMEVVILSSSKTQSEMAYLIIRERETATGTKIVNKIV